MPQSLQAASASQCQQIMQLRVNTPQALNRIGQHREKGDNPGNQHHSRIDIVKAEPNQNNWRNRHNRRDLQGYHIRVKAALNQPRTGEQNSQPNAANNRPEKSQQGDFQCHQQRCGQLPEMVNQCRANRTGRRQHKDRNIGARHPDFPECQQSQPDQHWQRSK